MLNNRSDAKAHLDYATSFQSLSFIFSFPQHPWSQKTRILANSAVKQIHLVSFNVKDKSNPTLSGRCFPVLPLSQHYRQHAALQQHNPTLFNTFAWKCLNRLTILCGCVKNVGQTYHSSQNSNFPRFKSVWSKAVCCDNLLFGGTHRKNTFQRGQMMDQNLGSIWQAFKRC